MLSIPAHLAVRKSMGEEMLSPLKIRDPISFISGSLLFFSHGNFLSDVKIFVQIAILKS